MGVIFREVDNNKKAVMAKYNYSNSNICQFAESDESGNFCV